MALPFEDVVFDLVFCQFGVMFFPDSPVAYREARRVLKPGGLFLFNVWDRIEENTFADDVTNALATMFPNDPPRFLARTPHGYHEKDRIKRDLEHAGFSSVDIDTRAEKSRAPSARQVAAAYCHGTPLRGEIELLDPDLDATTSVVTAALEDKHGCEEVVAKMQAHVVIAVA
jgi:SAM-dependent methyltransferase